MIIPVSIIQIQERPPRDEEFIGFRHCHTLAASKPSGIWILVADSETRQTKKDIVVVLTLYEQWTRARRIHKLLLPITLLSI